MRARRISSHAMRLASFRRLLAACAFAALPAMATLSGVSPSGFTVTHKADIDVAPESVYLAFGLVQKWWNPEHTYSGKADNLRIRLSAGGCFCESWEQNSVEHARVIYAVRDRAVRMEGAFGPLQEMALNAVLELKVAQRTGGSTFTMTYRVRGSPDAALDKLAPVVDRVMVEQAQRLVAYVESSAPKIPKPIDGAFDSAGVRIHYVELGRGEPVILLHDLGASADRTWVDSGAMATIAQAFRAIAPDFRGHGGSDKPAEGSGYGREMALDVLRLMDRLELRKAHIAGYGMGAQVAAWLAARHPERVQSLVLAGGGPLREGTAPAEAASWPGAAAMPELALANGDIARLGVPVMGIVGNQDAAALRELLSARGVMARPPRMASIEGGTHASTPASPDFAVAIVQFLRNYPMPPR